MICTQHSAESLPTSGPLSQTRAECSQSPESSDWNIWSCSWCRTLGHPDREKGRIIICDKVVFCFLWPKLIKNVYLHSVVFLVVVWTLAISESTFTIHPLHSPAEGAVGYFRVLLAGRLIWCWLLKDTKHTSAKSWQDYLKPLALFTQKLNYRSGSQILRCWCFTQSEISLPAASKRLCEWSYC